MLEELGFDSVEVLKTLNICGSATRDKRQFCAKSIQTNLELLLLNKEGRKEGKEKITRIALLLPHTFVLSCLPPAFGHL